MLIDLPARRQGRRLFEDQAIAAALCAGLRVVEARADGRLYAVHLGDGDQLLRVPVPSAPPAEIAFDECPAWIGVDLSSFPDLSAEWTIGDLAPAG